jgi:hypothetical protein
MNTLKKLHEIEKKKCIYHIHYCRAGVGIIFYEPPVEDKEDKPNFWKKYLIVDKYYPTFEAMIDAEYEKIISPKSNKTLHDGHIKLWDDLAKSGNKSKSSSSIWKDLTYKHLCTESVIRSLCFCCQFRTIDDCKKCPIKWSKEDIIEDYNSCFYSKDSPYFKWFIARTIKTRKKYAAIIRDMKWKEQ